MFGVDTKSQALLALMNARDPSPGLGTLLNQTKNTIKCFWNFAVLGGAVSTIPLLDDQGNAAILPLNAIVTNVTCYVLTAPTTSASGTISLGSNISSATTDLMAAKAPGALTLGSFVAGVPIGTAATWVGPVTAKAGSQLQATIATGALTAGSLEWIIEFVVF